MILFSWYSFAELNTQQLYSILGLRSRVFVTEQNCAYSDVDGKDAFAFHLLGTKEDSLVAYLRLFPPVDNEDHLIFGRVVTDKSVRNQGAGKRLLQELINYCDIHYPGINLKCSAQNHLTRFYGQFGFKTVGSIYDEDGIPHIEMRRKSSEKVTVLSLG